MKHFSSLALLACLLLALCACGQPSADSSSTSEAPIEAHRTVYGKIREANGNEITVALLNYTEMTMPTAAGGEAAPDAGKGTDSVPPPTGDTAQVAESGASMAANAAPGSGTITLSPGGDAPPGEGGPSGGRGPSVEITLDGDSTPRSAGGAGGSTPGGRGGGTGGMPMGGTNYTLTGEDATYLIPVTATITSGQGDNARTVRFTQLSYKNVVKIALDAEGNVLAIQVLQ